ncbi:hypothetical protein [Paractinoplanes abujensis]|uniref:hypothetical protein n=1 Tax=Paractinoplanes abujensis TaxID=882441 RepID=UPI00194407C6|nr:hypothetical protein [Actinoplanes abujensis]
MSLLVGDLSRMGVLERRANDRDRRRRIVDIAAASRPASSGCHRRRASDVWRSAR